MCIALRNEWILDLRNKYKKGKGIVFYRVSQIQLTTKKWLILKLMRNTPQF